MNQARFLDFNGEIFHSEEAILKASNRNFRYGDGVFESMRWENGTVSLLNFHAERLQKSMELLKMEGGKRFSESFLQDKIESLLRRNSLRDQACRVRLSVFRDGEGLYTPSTHESAYLLEVATLDKVSNVHNQAGLIIDVFTDHKKSANALANIKSANALLYVLASIYRKKHALDDVLLVNEQGFLVESANSNIFIWYRNQLYTPALSEGCVDGVMRRSIIEFATANDIEIIEAQINTQILNEAEEIFLTNAVHGMQCVLGYQKKRYFHKLSKELWRKYMQWQKELENQDAP